MVHELGTVPCYLVDCGNAMCSQVMWICKHACNTISQYQVSYILASYQPIISVRPQYQHQAGMNSFKVIIYQYQLVCSKVDTWPTHQFVWSSISMALLTIRILGCSGNHVFNSRQNHLFALKLSTLLKGEFKGGPAICVEKQLLLHQCLMKRIPTILDWYSKDMR